MTLVPRPIDRSGFTLTEMLVVAALVGILLTMVLVSAKGPTGADRTAANQVAAMLDRARARAIASGGLAAFAVASADARDGAWRRVAVFDVQESPSSPGEGVNRFQPKTTGDGRIEPVAPWVDLPGDVILFGKNAGGAPVESFVDAPESLRVPLARDGSEVEAKVLIFDGEGGVAYPESKPLRVVRIGRAEGYGTETELLGKVRETAANQPAVTVERFTGRIHIEN